MSLSLPLPSRSSQIRTLAITPASRKHKFLHIPQQWTPSRPLQHLHTNHQYYLSRTSFQCMSRSQQQEYEVERLLSNLNQVTLKREPGSLSSAILLVAGTTVTTGLLIAEVNVNTMCELGSGGVSLLVIHIHPLCPSHRLCGSLFRYFDELSRHSIMGKCNLILLSVWRHMLLWKVYQMGRSAPKSLSSLSLGPERKVRCYNGYFVNGYVFHTKEYGQGRKTYNCGVCVKGSTSSQLEVDYYGILEEVVELQYHIEQNKVFLFKCYWYDTTDRGIRVDPHHGLVEINSKARLRNINDVFVFAKQCQQVYYTYTPSFRKDRSRVDWFSILKTKPRGRVEVV
ncbi:uncharacterized protein [Populus alba]|uniref:uncharacterized protein isoform X3 n=1 Tax=Populus alba TaxID=43335 RepID=UPI003CC722B4